MLTAAVCVMLCRPAQEPLREPVAAAWRARDGHFAVLDAGGVALRVFDAELHPLWTRALDAPAFGLAADTGGWLLDAGDDVVQWLAGPDDPPVRFSADSWPAGFPARAQGPAGRGLVLEGGRLRLGLADWEHGGELEWGPSWGTWRARTARVLGPKLEWRRNGGDVRLAAVIADRADPLLQRAYLEPVAAGDRVALRFRPPTMRYPAEDWTPWVELVVPPAPPGEARPVTVLPMGL